MAVTKFREYQHYKDRRPIWIKFYVSLLDPKHPINELPVATRYLFDRLLLLAASYDNAIPNDSELIAKLLRMPTRDCREGIALLLKGRWIKETNSKRRASKRASKVASGSVPPDLEAERDIEKPERHAFNNLLPLSNDPGASDGIDPLAALIRAIGPIDEDGLAKVRGFVQRLPEGSVRKVAESLHIQRPRNRVGYAIAALRSELEAA